MTVAHSASGKTDHERRGSFHQSQKNGESTLEAVLTTSHQHGEQQRRTTEPGHPGQARPGET
eukprot:SAG11_NODE_540_length_8654_cov_9.626110_3_plen_62_part_00